jgi:anti-sigma-K factor RskA
MNEQDYILIDDYLSGLLDAATQQQVEERIATDAAFATALAETQKMLEWVRREPARRAFKETNAVLGTEFFAETAEKTEKKAIVVPMTQTRWWAAAAAVLLLAAAVWFVGRPPADLYPQYAMHTPPSLTVRSNGDQLAATAETAFKRADYAAALSALQQLAAQRPDDPTIQFYTGVCYLELQRASEARQVFTSLAQGSTVWRDEAKWYVALTHLKEKNTAACVEALSAIQSGEDRYETAQRLLKALR